MPPTFGTSLSNARFDPLADRVSLELGGDRQKSGHRSTRRCDEVESLCERDKRDAEVVQFGKRADQVSMGAAPAAELPHHDGVHFMAACCFQEFISFRAKQSA